MSPQGLFYYRGASRPYTLWGGVFPFLPEVFFFTGSNLFQQRAFLRIPGEAVLRHLQDLMGPPKYLIIKENAPPELLYKQWGGKKGTLHSQKCISKARFNGRA